MTTKLMKVYKTIYDFKFAINFNPRGNRKYQIKNNTQIGIKRVHFY